MEGVGAEFKAQEVGVQIVGFREGEKEVQARTTRNVVNIIQRT